MKAIKKPVEIIEVYEGMPTKDIRNLGLKLGAMAGFLAIVYFLVLYCTGANSLDPFYKFDFWVSIPFIIAALVYIRKSTNVLRIWQGLIAGFWITLVCASIIAIFYYVFCLAIDTDFIAKGEEARLILIESYIQKYTQLADTAAVHKYTQIYEGNKKLIDQKLNTPLAFAEDKIFWHYLVGGIVTFVSSILVRK